MHKRYLLLRTVFPRIIAYKILLKIKPHMFYDQGIKKNMLWLVKQSGFNPVYKHLKNSMFIAIKKNNADVVKYLMDFFNNADLNEFAYFSIVRKKIDCLKVLFPYYKAKELIHNDRKILKYLIKMGCTRSAYVPVYMRDLKVIEYMADKVDCIFKYLNVTIPILKFLKNRGFVITTENYKLIFKLMQENGYKYPNGSAKNPLCWLLYKKYITFKNEQLFKHVIVNGSHRDIDFLIRNSRKYIIKKNTLDFMKNSGIPSLVRMYKCMLIVRYIFIFCKAVLFVIYAPVFSNEY